jgi:hypothetical protein
LLFAESLFHHSLTDTYEKTRVSFFLEIYLGSLRSYAPQKDNALPQPMWGLFGPVTIKTKSGTRVTFVAGFFTIPLAAWSLWSLTHRPPTTQGGKGVGPGTQAQLPPPSEVDLSEDST